MSPPRFGWEEACSETLDAGGVDALAAVLSKHKDKGDMVAAVLQALNAIVELPGGCERMALSATKQKAGRRSLADVAVAAAAAGDPGLRAVVAAVAAVAGAHESGAYDDSMDADDYDGGIRDALALLDTLAVWNAPRLTAAGGVAAVNAFARVAVAKARSGAADEGKLRADTFVLVAQALDRISRNCTGVEALGVPAGSAATADASAALSSLTGMLIAAPTASRPSRSGRGGAGGAASVSSPSHARKRRGSISRGAEKPGTPRAVDDEDADDLRQVMLQASRVTPTQHFTAALRVIGRVARTDEGIALLHDRSQIKSLSEALLLLDAEKDRSVVMTIVGVLGTVVGDDVAVFVQQCSSPESSADDVDYASLLLANLALDGEVADALARGGHVPTLVGATQREGASEGAVANQFLALQRVAARGVKVTSNALLDAGISVTVKATVDGAASQAGVVAAALAVLAVLANAENKRHTPRLVSEGAAAAALRAIATHATNAKVVHAGFRVIFAAIDAKGSDLASGADPIDAAPSAIPAAVLPAMKASADAVAVQEIGAAIISRMTDAVVHGEASPAVAEAVAACVAAEAITITIANITHVEVVKSAAAAAASLQSLTNICKADDSAHVPAARDAGAVAAVLGAYTEHTRDKKVMTAFRAVIELLADAESIIKELNILVTSVVALTGSPDDDEAATAMWNAANALALLEATAVAPTFARVMHSCGIEAPHVTPATSVTLAAEADAARHGAVAILVAVLMAVAAPAQLERQDEVLGRVCRTLAHLASIADEADQERTGAATTLCDELFSAYLVGTVSSHMNLRPGLPEFARGAVLLLEAMTAGETLDSVEERINMVVGNGAVEGIVSVMRANASNKGVVEAAVRTLKRFTLTAKGALAVATRGGTRQILSNLSRWANRARARRAKASGKAASPSASDLSQLTGMFDILNSAALVSRKAKELLRKQGGLSSVLASAEAMNLTIDASNQGSKDNRLLASLIAQLASADEVAEICRTLVNFVYGDGFPVDTVASGVAEVPEDRASAIQAAVVAASEDLEGPMAQLALLAGTGAGRSAPVALVAGGYVAAEVSYRALGVALAVTSSADLADQGGSVILEAGVRLLHGVVSAFGDWDGDGEGDLVDSPQQAQFSQLLPWALHCLSYSLQGVRAPHTRGIALVCLPSILAMVSSPGAAASLSQTAEIQERLGDLLTLVSSSAESGDDVVLVQALRTMLYLVKGNSDGVAPMLRAAGAIEVLQDLFVRTVKQAADTTVSLILELLNALCTDVESASALATAGRDEGGAKLLAAVTSALSRFSGEVTSGQTADARVAGFAAAVNLLQRVQWAPEVSGSEAAQTAVANAIVASLSSRRYAEEATTAEAVMSLLISACDTGGEAVATALGEAGAQDLVERCLAVGRNVEDRERLNDLGSRALVALGSGSDAAESASNNVKEADEALRAALAAGEDVGALKLAGGKLASALQQLSSLLVVDGAVNQDNAAGYFSIVSSAVAAMRELGVALDTAGASGTLVGEDGDESLTVTSAVATGIQAIGRLSGPVASVDDVAESSVVIDVEEAVAVVMEALDSFDGDEGVQQTSAQCFSTLAASPAAVKKMVQGGAMAKITARLEAAPTAAAAAAQDIDGAAEASRKKMSAMFVQTLKTVQSAAIADVSQMLLDDAGRDALADVVEACAADSTEHLAECVAPILMGEDGIEAGWTVLERKPANAEVALAVQRGMFDVVRASVGGAASAASAAEVDGVSLADEQRTARFVKFVGSSGRRRGAMHTSIVGDDEFASAEPQIAAGRAAALPRFVDSNRLAALMQSLATSAELAEEANSLDVRATSKRATAGGDTPSSPQGAAESKDGADGTATPTAAGAEDEEEENPELVEMRNKSLSLATDLAKSSLSLLSLFAFPSPSPALSAEAAAARPVIAAGFVEADGMGLLLRLVKALPTLQLDLIRCSRSVLGAQWDTDGDAEPTDEQMAAVRSDAIGGVVPAHAVERSFFVDVAALLRKELPPAVIREVFWLLHAAVLAAGNDPADNVRAMMLTSDSMGAIQQSVRAHGEGDTWVTRAGEVLIDALSDVYAEQSGAVLQRALAKLASCTAAAGAPGAGDDAWQALNDALDRALTIAQKVDSDNLVTIDDTVGSALASLATLAGSRDAALAAATFELVGVLCRLKANCNAVVSSGYIATSAGTARAFVTDENAMLRYAGGIVKLSRDQTVWAPMLEAGIARLEVEALKLHVENTAVARELVFGLTNLSVDTAGSALELVAAGGVEALEKALRRHITDARMLADTLSTLSNIVYINDEIRLDVADRCMDLITAVFSKFKTDPAVFTTTLRVLGNLTLCDANTPKLIKAKIVPLILEGSEIHARNDAAVTMSLQVLKNIACTPNPPDAPPEAFKTAVTAASKASELLAVIRSHNESQPCAMAGMDLLHVLVEECGLVLRRLVSETSLLADVVFVMRSLDYDAQVTEGGADVLAFAISQDDTRPAVLDGDVLPLLLSLPDSHPKSARLMRVVCWAISALTREEKGLRVVAELGGVRSVIAAISLVGQDIAVIDVYLDLLHHWARSSDGLAQEVVSNGISSILFVFRTYLTLALAPRPPGAPPPVPPSSGGPVDPAIIVRKALGVLAAASAELANINPLFEHGVVGAIAQTQPLATKANARLVEEAMIIIGNMARPSDAHRVAAVQQGGAAFAVAAKDAHGVRKAGEEDPVGDDSTRMGRVLNYVTRIIADSENAGTYEEVFKVTSVEPAKPKPPPPRLRKASTSTADEDEEEEAPAAPKPPTKKKKKKKKEKSAAARGGAGAGTPVAPPKPVPHKGYMVKRGGGTRLFGRKSQKERYFLLEDGFFRYWTSKEEADAGEPSIKNARVCVADYNLDYDEDDWVIYLDAPGKKKNKRGRDWELTCADERDFRGWQRAFKAHGASTG